MITAKTIDEYISNFPAETQNKIREIREIIRIAAPEAEEVISYAMPAFKQDGMLVYFGAYKNHIGFYPTAAGIEAFRDRLADYKWSKGAVQFPIDQALPVELITDMVRLRVQQAQLKAQKKSKKR